MMNGARLETLARPASSSGNGSFKRIVKILVVGPGHLVDHLGEGLTQAVARHPAAQRSDAIGPADRELRGLRSDYRFFAVVPTWCRHTGGQPRSFSNRGKTTGTGIWYSVRAG